MTGTAKSVLIVCSGAPDIPHPEAVISRLHAGRFKLRHGKTTVWHNPAGRPTWTLKCTVPGCRKIASVNGDTARVLSVFLQAYPAFTAPPERPAISLRFLNRLLTNKQRLCLHDT